MNFNNFTIKSQEAVQKSIDLVREKGQQAIEPAHILWGLIAVGENIVNFLFQKLGINQNYITVQLEKQINQFPKVSGGEPYLGRDANAVFQKAQDYAKDMQDQYVSLEHLLLAVLAVKSETSQQLKDAGMQESQLKMAINELRKGNNVTSQSAEETYQSLEKYAINLTERAKEGK